jgi:3-oxoacyl-[acyl-carrier-protein] synthase II
LMVHDLRVVITGIGSVSACGWTANDLHSGLLSGISAIGETAHFDTTGQRTTVAGEVPPAPEIIVQKIPEWAALSKSDRFAVAAAIEAVEQAQILDGLSAAGLFFGGSTGGMFECEEYFGRLLGNRDGHPGIRLQASQQINSPGDAVARHLKLTGPVQTVSSACASGTLALGMALDELRSGQSDVVLAGGSDSLCLLTYSGFNSLRSVDSRPCRPFRADRQGLSVGEGAGVLVLETLEHAVGRGAVPLAELIGAGASCDASHMTAPHPEGEGAAAAIGNAIADARISPDRVDFVNAHGTGTPQNDVSESRALHSVFGARAATLPVTSNKATVGHLLGSAGAVEAVATVLSLIHGVIQPMPDGGDMDHELDLDIVLGSPRSISPEAVAISSSFAFGGANAAVVIAGWNEGSAG